MTQSRILQAVLENNPRNPVDTERLLGSFTTVDEVVRDLVRGSAAVFDERASANLRLVYASVANDLAHYLSDSFDAEQADTVWTLASNLWVAVSERHPNPSEPHAIALMNAGEALTPLAVQNPSVRICRQHGRLYERARSEGLVPEMEEWVISLNNEALSWSSLGRAGVEPESNLRKSIALTQAIRQVPYVRRGSVEWGRSLFAEGNAYSALASLGIEPAESLRRAIDLRQAARSQGLPPDQPDWAGALMMEATDLADLSELDPHPLPLLERAVRGFQECRRKPNLPPAIILGSTVNEARALLNIAERGEDPVANLHRCIRLTRAVRTNGLQPGTTPWANALNVEANAFRRLALNDVDRRENLAAAIGLYAQARREGFEPESSQWAMALYNEANARISLSQATGQRDPAARDLLLEALNLQTIPTIQRVNYLHLLGSISEGEDRLAFLGEAVAISQALRSRTRSLADRAEENERHSSLYAHYAMACLEAGEIERALDGIYAGKGRELTEDLRGRILARQADAPPSEQGQIVAEIEALDTQESLPTPAEAAHRARLIHTLANESRGVAAVLDDVPKEHAEVLAAARRLSGGEGFLVEFVMLEASRIGYVVQDLSGKQPPRAFRFEDQRLAQACVDFLNAVELLERVHNFGRWISLFQEGEAPFWWEGWIVENPTPDAFLYESFRKKEIGAMAFAVKRDELIRSAHRDSTGALVEISALLLPDLLQGIPPEAPVILAPHWLLNTIPFHALPTSDPQYPVLIARNPVAYLPCAALAPSIEEILRDPSNEAMIFGDPTEDLKAAAKEAEIIGELLDCGRVSLGASATRGRLRDEMGQIGILHMSGHGKFNADRSYDSALILRSEDGGEDRLTMADIVAELEFKHGKLAFLSACESGKQRLRQSNDAVGLARAFLVAGFPSIVASLWLAWDQVAQDFAVSFYRTWKEEPVSVAEAFRRACLATRAGREDEPYYWSNFILVGAWQTRY